MVETQECQQTVSRVQEQQQQQQQQQQQKQQQHQQKKSNSGDLMAATSCQRKKRWRWWCHYGHRHTISTSNGWTDGQTHGAKYTPSYRDPRMHP